VKGIILAGGVGSRLFPITSSVPKALLPVYNKPMIYYPLSTLLLAGIKDILIICTSSSLELFKNLLGNGAGLGISLTYKVQDNPDGIAQAFVLGEDFIKDDNVCLILGDNLLYGHTLPEKLNSARESIEVNGGGVVFGYRVANPSAYGVAEIKNQKIIGICEKPEIPKSNIAVVGLYMYDNSVISASKEIRPSARGELEITDVNKLFIKNNNLSICTLGRGFTWFDTGSSEDLFSASSFVRMIEERQGLKVACIEEIAYYMNYITLDDVKKRHEEIKHSAYGMYLKQII
jgi:glucose-1-phosphate thymidylyltransferase